jgi:adenylylsulfate kinase-like enzyme
MKNELEHHNEFPFLEKEEMGKKNKIIILIGGTSCAGKTLLPRSCWKGTRYRFFKRVY